ncbi:amino acid/amide ABC transporter substrate-binding protein (HAAT family) [Nocardia tenerifensis]|uniref:Amino acid/amide ABC transporter substrate-binding protein (HAAT family) n=1 Tax=Nocardia tenerifensis TaxID=228006 RepID=A0A318JXZ7_9NOCA|nr:ABC transporter substrate-binding protein [Nocardia tenerifensis]PXX63122.1 amino acid/amide ABC transporter substrate-binding protein (HAAT family) [Nocardia tenerifensis]
MRDKAIRAVGAAVAVLLTVTACGGRDEAGGTVTQGDCKGQQSTGITDKSIKLGGVYPLSGPASAYGELPKGSRAYFDYINAEQGGIGGRKVEFLIRDDGYQPPKTVEETRRLVENDQVFAVFSTLGTATSSAVWDYLDQRKVPQAFVAGGATKWGSDTHHPWTIGWQPSYRAEGQAYAGYVRAQRPNATVAVLYQNDDFGKDLLTSFTEATAGSGIKVVSEQSYEVTDPTVEPQLRNLANSKADVLLNFSTPKFASQALAADARNTDWNPLHILAQVSNTVSMLTQVGFQNVQGVVSVAFMKDPADAQWSTDSGMHTYQQKVAQYARDADPANQYTAVGWAMAQTLHKTMDAAKCPTREGLRDAMHALDHIDIDLLLPGVTIKTGPGDGFPLEAMRIQRFEGEHWTLIGDVIDTSK